MCHRLYTDEELALWPHMHSVIYWGQVKRIALRVSFCPSCCSQRLPAFMLHMHPTPDDWLDVEKHNDVEGNLPTPAYGLRGLDAALV